MEEKIVKQVYEVSPPLTELHIFLRGSGKPEDEHDIIGFHGYDKDGKFVYGIGVNPEEMEDLPEFKVYEISDN